ncbi:bifunctional hydroxymethylpyrimidine kinase/phosphomethylpyrimidine kinase [Zooshikella harenae]|uniref:hydroxymethylpyrimidine kinase n=1 Tax=Zooshikella harenae TaxID=2827238 RepID=A0ABS5ZBJ8_9GAMM|nr:bifunctional hydroxymethylpyrimidine kinase/phosphomethylpyrimidine kinase [Zooshikella harenae]MBU2711374.1 bifunctional hydroxymethylpyrimidine kinase/phosphomethylpyrimidine kinase [Zooshikella harenae]
MSRHQPPVILSIAGSDSGAGAGIQADLKTISATGGYACTVLTAVTAQNTCGVLDVFPISSGHVAKQLDAVFTDFSVIAVKTGMLFNTDIIKIVAAKLCEYNPQWLVVDTVLASTSGKTLLQKKAINAMLDVLFPLADVVTPNLIEANILIGEEKNDYLDENQPELINKLQGLKTKAVLLKGGHSSDQENCTDVLILPDKIQTYSAPRVVTSNTHGTGCTLSAALASYLGQGFALEVAVEKSKRYLTEALRFSTSWRLGEGHGPVNHFFDF